MNRFGKNNTNFKHGKTGTRLFRTWVHMRQRCMNPNDKRFSDYGGRGISVCSEWGEYLNFEKWALENGYRKDLTIDRINNDGNYEPSNCRWTTNKEQCNNRRSNRIIEVDGIKMNEKQWAEFLGIPRHILSNRLHRGMSETEAVKKPVRVNIGGKYQNVNYYELANKRLEDFKSQLTIFDCGVERVW